MALTNSNPQFRKRYGQWINPLPSDDTLAEDMDFVEREKRPGGQYAFPVLVSQEQGITLNSDGSTFSTNASIDAVIKEAQIDGAEIAVTVDMSAAELAKSANGASLDSQNAPAYFEIPDLKMQQAMLLGERGREVMLGFGPGTGSAIAADIGVVNASISGANLAAPQVVNLTRASWMPGLWPLMQNALVDIYQSDGTTLRESGVTMQTITDESKNRIQLFKTASANTVAANDRIVLAGAKGKSCYGIQAIGENTGTLFNIDALANIVWRVQQTSSFGSPTRAKIMQLAAKLKNRGVTKGGTLYCCSSVVADLTEEIDTNGRVLVDERTPTVKKQGTSRLIYTTACGDITVKAHTYWKQGFMFFLAQNPNGAGTVGKRVGATDFTFDEQRGGMMFRPLEGSTGARIRGYSNQAPILQIPWMCSWISGVTSNADTLPA